MSRNDRQIDAFSPYLLSVEKRPPSPLPSLFLRLLLLLLLIVLVWAFVGKLDIVARADGRLVPKTRVQIVQPLEDGRVSRILVKEGERVVKGQVLFTMDAQLTSADKRKYGYELSLSQLQLRRVKAELAGRDLVRLAEDDPSQYQQVRAQFEANRSAYQTQTREAQAEKERIAQDLSASQMMVRSLAKALPVYEETESAFKKLENKGYGGRLSALEKRRERIQAEQDLEEEQYRVKSLSARRAEAASRVERIGAEYRRQLVKEQVELIAKIHQLSEEIGKLAYREGLTELTSPTDGTVQDVATHTEGSVVPAGTVVMTVVPSKEPLKAEVMVENQDVGFIRPGQAVKVKLASYEFQKYGMLDAQVEYVSPDAVEQDKGDPNKGGVRKYRVFLDLARQFIERDGKRYALRPGMQIVSEINLGTRSVIEYVLSPIQQGVLEAGMER